MEVNRREWFSPEHKADAPNVGLGSEAVSDVTREQTLNLGRGQNGASACCHTNHVGLGAEKFGEGDLLATTAPVPP